MNILANKVASQCTNRWTDANSIFALFFAHIPSLPELKMKLDGFYSCFFPPFMGPACKTKCNIVQ